MLSFTWKGKNSFSDYGILISQRPPISKAERNIEEIEIPGRNGDLTIDYNTYKSITIPLECTLSDGNYLDEIKVWLDGFDKLILSWQEDRYYNAKSVSGIDIEQSIEIYGDFPIIFKAQPFGYSISNDLITLVSQGTVFNPGTINSKPVIKVFGTGSIVLNINSTVINLTNVSGYVTIDSELVDAYKDTLLKNTDMAGNFQELIPGNNTISWSGTVTKIEITPNWRWL